VRVVELMDLPNYLSLFRWCGIGRKPSDRLCMLKSFVAKGVFGCLNTKCIIETLNCSRVVRRLRGCESVGTLPSVATPNFAL